MPGLPNLTTIATRPALDRWSAARAEHDSKVWTGDACACKCGWTPPRRTSSPARSVGLHQSAAEKRADKAYDAECKPIIDLLLRPVQTLLTELDSVRAAASRATEAGDTSAARAAMDRVDLVLGVLRAHAELGDVLAAAEVARYDRLAAQAAVRADDCPGTRLALREAIATEAGHMAELRRRAGKPDADAVLARLERTGSVS